MSEIQTKGNFIHDGFLTLLQLKEEIKKQVLNKDKTYDDIARFIDIQVKKYKKDTLVGGLGLGFLFVLLEKDPNLLSLMGYESLYHWTKSIGFTNYTVNKYRNATFTLFALMEVAKRNGNIKNILESRDLTIDALAKMWGKLAIILTNQTSLNLSRFLGIETNEDEEVVNEVIPDEAAENIATLILSGEASVEILDREVEEKTHATLKGRIIDINADDGVITIAVHTNTILEEWLDKNVSIRELARQPKR